MSSITQSLQAKPAHVTALESALAAGANSLIDGKASTKQTGKTFLDKVVGGINSVTSKITWGKTQVQASVDQNTLFIIGGLILAVVLLSKKK